MAMTSIADRAARRWELHHPALLAAIGFGVMMLFGAKIYAYADCQNWKIDQLYTCVFTISTVFTAFLFTFYTFVVTAERGFLARAKASIYFKQTVKFTLNAIWVGGILCAATVPLLVVQPVPTVGDPWLVVVALWVAMTIWAGASFVRAAHLFSIFSSNQMNN
jgi:hypothetical protein